MKKNTIRITDASKTDVTVVGGNSIVNAPLTTKSNQVIEPMEVTLEKLNEVTARIIRGDDISYTESNFQSVMHLIGQVSQVSLDKDNARKVEEILEQLKKEKNNDQFDIQKVNELMGQLQALLNMVTIAPGIWESLKNLIHTIPGFFGA